MQSMWAAPLGLRSADADQVLRSGFKHELQGRNWRLLANKLATPGSRISVVAFGGSVTVGHYATCENSSWPEEAVAWMQAAFPEVDFDLVNLGHGATTAAIASLCYYQVSWSKAASTAATCLACYTMDETGASNWHLPDHVYGAFKLVPAAAATHYVCVRSSGSSSSSGGMLKTGTDSSG
eukprot:GHRQ01027557.1.p1 GENE.GHRQ01027557.1~~GHRQ01027557.1.p1  ORF type:complete len:180 (-),score=40.39 GHRQ01027557.1:33-572(-)